MQLKRVFGEKNWAYLTAKASPGKRMLHILCQTLALIFFMIALARPLFGSRQTEIKQSGLELVIAMDVSNSMLAEDDKPSRMQLAKRKISDLFDKVHCAGDNWVTEY
jgi:Ca-activated chloride channel family protein